MKHKGIILLVTAVCIITGIILFSRQQLLGNMTKVMKDPTSGTSDFSFEGHKGDRIKLSYNALVKNGKLDFILYNSSGKVVKELDSARALEIPITLDYDDNYVFTATYTDFTGEFKAKVFKIVW
jgi:hypothetical protein